MPELASELRKILSHSSSCMDHQEEQIAATGCAVQVLVTQVLELTIQLQCLTNEPIQPVAANPSDSAGCFNQPVDLDGHPITDEGNMSAPHFDG